VSQEWITEEFIPSVQKRSQEIIEFRKLSPFGSTAEALVDQMHDWVFGSHDWQSIAMYTNQTSYRSIPNGVVFSMPYKSDN
jgi:malate dehydrogenase